MAQAPLAVGRDRRLEPSRGDLDGIDVHPRFSPDGKWVVFASDRAGFKDEWVLSGMFPQPYGDLFAVRTDGAGPAVQLTDDKWEDSLAVWTEVRRSPGASSPP
jgi:Tol biopolymer transport system component